MPLKEVIFSLQDLIMPYILWCFLCYSGSNQTQKRYCRSMAILDIRWGWYVDGSQLFVYATLWHAYSE